MAIKRTAEPSCWLDEAAVAVVAATTLVEAMARKAVMEGVRAGMVGMKALAEQKAGILVK